MLKSLKVLLLPLYVFSFHLAGNDLQGDRLKTASENFLLISSDTNIITKFSEKAMIDPKLIEWPDLEKKSPLLRINNINHKGPIQDAFLKFKLMFQEGDEIHRWEDHLGIIPIPPLLQGIRYNSTGYRHPGISLPIDPLNAKRTEPPSRFSTSPGTKALEAHHTSTGLCLMRNKQVHAVLITELVSNY